MVTMERMGGLVLVCHCCSYPSTVRFQNGDHSHFNHVVFAVLTGRLGEAALLRWCSGAGGWGLGAGVGCWVLGVGCWVLGVGCWVLGVGCWVLGVGCWVLGVGCWVLGVGGVHPAF